METAEHIDALERDGQLLATAADRAGLNARVPSCPDWQVRDLLRHIGYVHRWAASYVAGQQLEMADELTEAQQLSGGPCDSDLIGWFRDGHAALIAALSAAPADVACWTFLPAPSPLAFWARRQAHETAIHRADAELASGSVTAFEPAFAADGADELLIAFFGRDADAGSADSVSARPERILQVQATDADQDWHIRLSPDGGQIIATGRGACSAASAADCTLTGPASGLYLLLWNRADPAAAAVAVSGDAGLLRSWRDGMRVTWA